MPGAFLILPGLSYGLGKARRAESGARSWVEGK
ncbi:MAG: hypothetical protein XD51_0557 [Moorella sp. 60_41]|nr:MAG: hypothetical protein XD51_0557 [Moorella sp. 60_41]